MLPGKLCIAWNRSAELHTPKNAPGRPPGCRYRKGRIALEEHTPASTPPETSTPSPDSLLLDPKKVEKRRSFLINLLYFGILLAIAILAVRTLFVWMLPFVFAFLVAAVLQRPLRWLVKKTRVSKKFFSVVLVVLVILLLATAVALIGGQLVAGVVSFFSNTDNIRLIEATVESVSVSIQDIVTGFSNMLSPEALASLQGTIDSLTDALIGLVSSIFTGAAGWALSMTGRLPSLLVSFVIWVIASIFLTIDYQKVLSFFMRQVPERHTALVCTVRDLCTNTLFKLVKAYALLMLITFAELSVGLTILRVPYSLLVAAIIAVVDILPVLGTGTVLIPWALISAILGDFRMFVGLALLYVFITVLRNFLEPKLVSRQIGLNPLVTLFFMYLGLQAMGLPGMLLFPVTVMILKQLQDQGSIQIWK